MRWILLVAQVLLMSALALMQSGCLAAAAGGATAYVYDKGVVETTADAGVEKTIAATKLAMADLNLPILSSYASSLEGEVQARIGTDNKATVTVKSLANTTSRVFVRIGTFGDEAMSRQIIDRIQANLKGSATRPTVP